MARVVVRSLGDRPLLGDSPEARDARRRVRRTFAAIGRRQRERDLVEMGYRDLGGES